MVMIVADNCHFARNGYEDGDLTSAPSSWGNVQCKIKKKTLTCSEL